MIATALHVQACDAGTPLEDIVEGARRAGFDGMAVDVPVVDGGLESGWHERLADCGMLTSIACADARISLSGEPARAREMTRTLLIAAARLRAGLVEVQVGGDEIGYLEALHATYEGMLDLMVDAERLGVRLALSTRAPGFPRSPVELRDLVERVNSPCAVIALDWDTVPGDALDWLTILGPRVADVRGGADMIAHAGPVREILLASGATTSLTCCAPVDLDRAAQCLSGGEDR